ncbi:MAG: WD40 repeat domain-containing protein [Ardenticatenaceae bacterium]|nr:WD40 repeat domain-containing protein [Ardenticatenaceae bacterium]
MSFEWQTEEDSRWDEDVAPPEPPKRARRRWSWWLLLGVVLVGTAVFLAYRQLNQRVETATENVEADLLASYAVLQRAAQSRDENLFGSLISGRDDEWSQAQRDLLNAGLLFDRSGFGLEWMPQVAETAVISQTFSPELTAAELTTVQNYGLDIGNGLTQTVQLARTDVYRLGADRWLYAPPEPEFWGETQTVEGQLLSVDYPARDEAIVQRLAADLEAKLVQVCNTEGYECPPDARVRIDFSSKPNSLRQTTTLFFPTSGAADFSRTIWRGDDIIVLPTPTLVGMPLDETGYGAIFRGYASSVLTIAINELVGWNLENNLAMYRAILERQLYELGIGNWPLADTAVLFSDDYYSPGFRTFELSLFWNNPFPAASLEFDNNPLPYILVDFLLSELNLGTADIAKALVLSKEERFIDWLNGVSGLTWTEAIFSDAFRNYISRWQASPRVLPEPEDGLLLLCQNPLLATQGMYYFDDSLTEPLLLESLPYDELRHFIGLPGGDGLAVMAQESATGQPETYLLFNGTERVDVDWSVVEGVTSRPPLAVPTMVLGNGRYLLWTITRDYANGNFFVVTDVDACQAGSGCGANPVGGYPTWSPSAEQLITLSIIDPWWTEGMSDGMMLLRTEPTATAINSPGFGASVFWLDETRFGYLTQYQNGLQQLVLSDVTLSGPRVLLTNLSLLADEPPPGDRPARFSFQFVQPLPNSPSVLALLVRGQANGQTSGHLYFYDYEMETVVGYVLLENWRNAQVEGYRFSPDGRFLFITYANPDETAVNLTIYDTHESRVFHTRLDGDSALPRHFYASWSPDGAWLAMPEMGYIRLWHNGRDERLLNFEGLGCTNAAWVARMEP